MQFRSLAHSGLNSVSICSQPYCLRAYVCPRRFDDARIRRRPPIQAEPNSNPQGFGAKTPSHSKKNKKKKKSEGSKEYVPAPTHAHAFTKIHSLLHIAY
jgi:hypothetical protein